MDNSHKSISPVKYGIQYWYVSVLLTFGLTLYAYWDVIKLRYFSDFFEATSGGSGAQEVFILGFKNNLGTVVSGFLPIVITLILSLLVAYTLYNSYKFTVYDLDVNNNYVNVKKVSTVQIVAHYVAMYTASFILPLLYWCMYLTYIFPTLVKVPLNYIVGSSTYMFALVAVATLFALAVLMQIGLAMTRLTTKILSIR